MAAPNFAGAKFIATTKDLKCHIEYILVFAILLMASGKWASTHFRLTPNGESDELLSENGNAEMGNETIFDYGQIGNFTFLHFPHKSDWAGPFS